jgi:hypothetical protein
VPGNENKAECSKDCPFIIHFSNPQLNEHQASLPVVKAKLLRLHLVFLTLRGDFQATPSQHQVTIEAEKNVLIRKEA